MSSLINQKNSRVREVRTLSSSAYVLRFDRFQQSFSPGQYINLGLPHIQDMREYSLYSGRDADYFEVLIKDIPDGLLSPQFRKLDYGDLVKVEGPFGFFTIKEQWRSRNLLFVATGTGISPFHSFVKSYPELDYRLLHGIPFLEESYESQDFDSSRLVRCVSRSAGGDYYGRVTDFLKANPVKPGTLCFLCGNSNMIYEVFEILRQQGIESEEIFAEVYF